MGIIRCSPERGSCWTPDSLTWQSPGSLRPWFTPFPHVWALATPLASPPSAMATPLWFVSLSPVGTEWASRGWGRLQVIS